MTDELSSVPVAGGSEPASTTNEAAPSQEQGAAAPAKPSIRETLEKAAATVSEREQGAAVLRDGVGADEKLVGEAEKANAAAERARKGWDTRRTNEQDASARAAEEAKNKELGKTIAAAVKDGQQQVSTDPKPASTDTKHPTAPARFMKESHGDWEKVPESIRAETHRAVTELEAGIAKHKEGSERWTELAEFDAMAKQHGTTVKQALANYIQADQLFARDPVKGVEHILKARGIDIHEFAEHILDREAGTASPGNDPIVAELRQEVANLKGELTQFKTGQRQSVRQQIDADVAAFTKTHPRVADPDFESEMSFFITSGKAKTLQEAYDLAERLIPAPAGPNVANPDPADQTRKASFSPTGAPGAGSNPAGAARRRSSSIREAVQRAAQTTGLG